MTPSWSERLRWPVFILPFAVYMLVGSLEPSSKEPGAFFGFTYDQYPVVYSAKLALTVVAMLAVWPGYQRIERNATEGVPYRARERSQLPLALVVGVLGGALWIGMSRLNLEAKFFESVPKNAAFDWLRDLGKLGERPGFNPFEEIKDNPTWAAAFLAIRFVGLVLIVPIIEEFFLRGFVVRYVISPEWWTVPFGQWHKGAFVLVALYGVVTHPPEFITAALWFSLVSWLMLRTQSLWACVLAHAVTNLMLGIYVVASGHWSLM